MKNLRMKENCLKIMNSLEEAYYSLCGEKDALSALKQAANRFSVISGYSKKYEELSEKLNDLYYAAEDAAMELREAKLDFDADFDPSRIDEVEQRIDTVSNMKRKYGGSIENVISYKEECQERLFTLENAALENEKYAKQLELIHEEYNKASSALSELRKTAAVELEKRLLSELFELGMEKARFEVAFTEKSEDVIEADGKDKAVFMLSANSGESLKGLAQVASGGEMSRIMLSFKTVFADNDNIDTMIFDEIDTGISGKVADAVGEKMRRISKNRQVICVTHLPQIAAMSENHHQVRKNDDGESTVVTVELLNEESKVRAIASMLGSNEEETALNHARQLISKK